MYSCRLVVAVDGVCTVVYYDAWRHGECWWNRIPHNMFLSQFNHVFYFSNCTFLFNFFLLYRQVFSFCLLSLAEGTRVLIYMYHIMRNRGRTRTLALLHRSTSGTPPLYFQYNALYPFHSVVPCSAPCSICKWISHTNTSISKNWTSPLLPSTECQPFCSLSAGNLQLPYPKQ